MKKVIAFLSLLALFASTAFSATLVPIQLLNPTGSTAGQMLVSSGASSAPAWSNSPTITGGSINNAAIGANTPSSGVFTTLVATGQSSLGGTTGAEALRAVTTASAVNWVQAAGATTGNGVTLSAQGSDSNIQLNIDSKGSGGVYFFGQGAAQLSVLATASATRNLTVTGSNGGNPTIGTSAGNIALSAALAPSTTLGIIGTTAGDNANAGSYGEHQTNSTLTTSLSTGVPANATSISLTAGNWLIYGIAQFNAAAGTTTSSAVAGISSTSATFGTVVSGINNYALVNYGSVGNASVGTNLAVPVTWVNPTTTTTYYLVAQAGFATSTMTVSGYIWAIRIR